MDTLAITLRDWAAMEIFNSSRLLRLLHFAQFLLAHLFNSFSGRHWGFLCSTIFAVLSGHFAPVAHFFVEHMPTSTYLFAMQLPYDDLAQFIHEAEFANELLREFVSFHEFKQRSVHDLLFSVLFSAADLLTLLLLSNFLVTKLSHLFQRPVSMSPMLLSLTSHLD